MSEKSSDSVAVPPTAYAQLSALRDAGGPSVGLEAIRILKQCDFKAASKWVRTHPKAYQQGIDSGFGPINQKAVPEEDSAALKQTVPPSGESVNLSIDATTKAEQQVVNALSTDYGLVPAATEYATDGSWRTIEPLKETEQFHVVAVEDMIDCKPQKCPRNAQFATLRSRNSEDATYVEGYAVVDSLPVPVQHAWLELNDKVIELSFPEDPQSETAAYFGKPYPSEAVRAQFVATGDMEFLAD